MTTDGRDLGTIVEIYFDTETGKVEGYEVSGGLFADTYSGRSFVPAVQTIRIGEDVAFVSPETARLMEERVGGIKAAIQTAGESLEKVGNRATTSIANAVISPAEQKEFVIGKIAKEDVTAIDGTPIVVSAQVITPIRADLAENKGVLDQLYRAAGGSVKLKAVEQLQETATTASDRLQQAASVAGEKLEGATQNVMANYAVERAQGRRVRQMVLGQDNQIVAAVGQIVTPNVIEQAKRENREQALLEAVGLSTTEAMQTQTSATMRSAGDRLQTTAQTKGEQLKDGVVYLWEKVNEKVDDLVDSGTEVWERQQIKNALGRPVTRVILDNQDNVILNVGDLITHQAIEDARQAGVLDILLNSVHDQNPELSSTEFQASEEGKASLKAEAS